MPCSAGAVVICCAHANPAKVADDMIAASNQFRIFMSPLRVYD
jgi:hypothetical protein